MNSSNFDDFDGEDRRLVAFLQQNKPIAPDPATNLEQRIMAEIARQPISRMQSHQQPWRKRLLFAQVRIAAGWLVIWSVNRA
ncbi:MAG: hypothetical protein HC856_03740, partial [Pseudanabaena sp. RU_4_16]|nr:hypothetical protein [Pseudanabaena sp. RU_4_16]